MRERPIIFGADSVRAILKGKKTQTRRIIKPQPLSPRWQTVVVAGVGGWVDAHGKALRNPYGAVGDRLWVREAFRLRQDQDDKPPSGDWWKAGAWYAADGSQPTGCGGGPGKLRTPLFMPRWASRITLDVAEIRVERLQSISDEDARAEGHGVTWGSGCFHRSFAGGWDALNAKRGFPWASNPWVWVISFRENPTS